MTSIVKTEEDHLLLAGSGVDGAGFLAQAAQVVAELPQAGYDSGWNMMKLPGKNGYRIRHLA